MYKKTIFISLCLGVAIRNILRGGVFEKLKQNKDLRIVLLSPLADDPEFVEEFKGDNVFFEKLILYDKNKFKKAFVDVKKVLSLKRINTATTKIKHVDITGRDDFKKKVFRFFSPAMENDYFWNFLLKVEPSLFDLSHYDKLFEKYKPDLVFTTGLVAFDERLFLRRAVEKDIPTASMVMSWDNLTSKGCLDFKPDKAIVWNKIMKKEAVELHGFREEDVLITGAPQFDIYAKENDLTKEKFFEENNIPQDKKLITYATVTPKIFSRDYEIIEMILNAIKEDKFSVPCHLLIRPHQKDDFELYYKFKDDPNVTLQIPVKKSKVLVDQGNFKKKDSIKLIGALKYSDVLVNVNSTVTIDAAIFDTPVVNIVFDGYEKLPFMDSVRRYFEYPHFKELMAFNATALVHDEKELIDSIENYLVNPVKDSTNRQIMVENECYIIDGKASERIANILIKEMGD